MLSLFYFKSKNSIIKMIKKISIIIHNRITVPKRAVLDKSVLQLCYFFSFNGHLWLFLSITVNEQLAKYFDSKRQILFDKHDLSRRIFVWALRDSNSRHLPCKGSALFKSLLGNYIFLMTATRPSAFTLAPCSL